MVEITARIAEQKDASDILMMLTEQHEEWGDDLPPMDNATTLMHVKQLIDDGLVVVARTPEGELAGSIGMRADRWWFNPEAYFLTDFWTYVRRGFRRTKCAVSLFRRIKEFSDQTQIPLVLGIFTRDQQSRKNVLYRRHFDSMGEQFSYGLKDQARKRRQEAA